MNYLVIDLEMCKVPKHYRTRDYKYPNEIIQIGAVLLDENYKRIDEFERFVHPEHGVVDRFIEKLTGIKNQQLKEAADIKTALLQLIEWIGNREYKIYAWSESDRAQILNELSGKHIENDEINTFVEYDRWVDYQSLFMNRYGFSKCVKLDYALELADIEIQGRLHDGLDDAFNTSRLIEKLETDPDFKLISYYILPELQTAPLSFTLGEIFSDLQLQRA